MSKAKQDAKAFAAAKAQEKAALQAAGVTKELKKQMAGDVLLCTSCQATKLGPLACRCKGGAQKPAPDYDATMELLAAAKARHGQAKEAAKADTSQQKAVQAQRAKKKEARSNDDFDDPDLVVQGDGDDLLQVVEFEVGKLGMSIEKSCISAIGDPPSQAANLGVKKGWVIAEVNGAAVPDKKDPKPWIMKEAMAAMKKGPLQLGFRVPITDGFHWCVSCKKFVAEDAFTASQLTDEGPGKQMCYECEEFAEMGF